MLTQARLKELLSYDPETGMFTWLVGQGKRTDMVGKTAGFDCNGYVYINLSYQKYPAHRLAWLYVHGEFPVDEIDHENRCRHDNRMANLRHATRSQNVRNSSVSSRSKTGVTGVCFDRQTGKWRAHISPKRKMKSLGRFDAFSDAVAARRAAELELFGEYAPRAA